MKYEFICKMCGTPLRSTSKATLVLSAQNHYSLDHGLSDESEESSDTSTNEKQILREINPVRI